MLPGFFMHKSQLYKRINQRWQLNKDSVKLRPIISKEHYNDDHKDTARSRS